MKRADAKVAIEEILNRSKELSLSNKESKEIQNIVKKKSIWDELKKSGKRGIPHGDATLAFQRINELLIQNGVYVVPVGELESFIPTIGGHGPNWVNAVLESYPDLDDSIYDDIQTFVKDMQL